MDCDIFRFYIKLLEFFETEFLSAVSPLAISDLVVTKPDQVDLLPLDSWMVTVPPFSSIRIVFSGSLISAMPVSFKNFVGNYLGRASAIAKRVH